MFVSIQPHQIAAHRDLLRATFRLRKRVFADQLNWEVPVIGDEERDEYDELGASYLVWCSEDRRTVYGLLRLMPTTGPTLLHDVFHATHGNSAALMRADVWEGTRMCIDEAALRRDMPEIDGAKAFSILFLALCEMALGLGVRRMVSNYELAMSRIYRRAGLECEVHGHADGYGLRPVYCASFEVSPEILAGLRARHKIGGPLLVEAPLRVVAEPAEGLAA